MSFVETKFVGVRKIIAETMMKSLQSTAQYSTDIEIDATNLVKIRNELSTNFLSEAGIKLTYTPLFVKIVSNVISEFPLINSIVEGDTIKTFEEINVSIAVDTANGLMVPVLKNVEKKSLREIALEVEDLAKKARSGTLNFEDIVDGTFTITNVGMYGVISFTPILNIPQVAILGTGAILKKPIFKENKVQVSDILHLSLTADHRVVDGALSAKFLKGIKDVIEDEALLKSILTKEA